MIGHRVVSLIVVGVITATVFVSGPIVPVDFTTHPSSCEAGVPVGEGSADVQPSSVPESATLTQSKFGAEVWQLNVPDVTVQATDVRGCVRLNYEVSIDELGITMLSTTTLSDDSSAQISLPKTTLHPDRVDKNQYDGELRVIYHGEENGVPVERTVLSRTIPVEVAK